MMSKKTIRIIALLLLICAGTATAAWAAVSNYSYEDQPLYINGQRQTELALFRGNDVYIPITEQFQQSTGIDVSKTEKGYLFKRGQRQLEVQFLSKLYRYNGLTFENGIAPLRTIDNKTYLNLDVLCRLHVASSWEFSNGTLYLTTNGANPYRNLYRVVSVGPGTMQVQDYFTNKMIHVALAGIQTSTSLNEAYKETYVNIEFSNQGQDPKGNYYAYIWSGSQMLNTTLLRENKAALDPSFSGNQESYYQELLAANP